MNKQTAHSIDRTNTTYITVSIFRQILNTLNEFVESEELLFEITKPIGVKG